MYNVSHSHNWRLESFGPGCFHLPLLLLRRSSGALRLLLCISGRFCSFVGRFLDGRFNVGFDDELVMSQVKDLEGRKYIDEKIQIIMIKR